MVGDGCVGDERAFTTDFSCSTVENVSSRRGYSLETRKLRFLLYWLAYIARLLTLGLRNLI